MLETLETPLDRCLAIVVDAEPVVQRLIERAKLEGRTDDNEQTIRARMQVYEQQTAPLLEYYGQQELLSEVDGMGTVDDVAARIREVIE